ncbi:MAG: putative DNA-binding domain-containing protein [Nitrosomonadales bacterium]|nr:putative DNA-binding domain-containing protein [Nitrosomonadales bacterium]
MLDDDLTRFARAIVCGEAPPTQFDAWYGEYPVATAIEVYRNNYRGNLHDALAGAYPVIQQLVGEEFFRYLARNFVEQHPSRSANLHHYGAELADFLSGFAPVQELAYLPDVAALEWACHVAYFLADEPMFDLGRLMQIAPERYSELRLRTHPACQVLRSNYPVSAIWHAHQPGADSDFRIELEGGHRLALVSRPGDAVQVSELSPADADWLLRIQAGVSLGETTAVTLEQFPEFDLQAALLKLVAQQVLIDFSLEPLP